MSVPMIEVKNLTKHFGSGANIVRILIARMHHCPDRLLTERVSSNVVRTPDPAAAIGMLKVVDHRPTYLRRTQVFRGMLNALRYPVGKQSHITLLNPGTQRSHHRRREMSVSSGHEHMAGRNTGQLRSFALRLVYKFARHHQCVDHTDSDLILTVAEHQGPGMKRLVHFACSAL